MRRSHHTQSGVRNGLSRRSLLQLAGAGAALPIVGSALSGCGSAGSAGGGDKLTFVYRGDATQQDAFNKLFEEFNKTKPKIKLEPQGIAADTWGDFANTVATRVAGGQVPDIIQVATEGQRTFASKGILAPLDDFMDSDSDVVDDYFNDINPNLVDWNTKYASTDENTYYIPGGYNTVCFWYNTETWEKAGAEPPTADWTWDDFMTAAEKLKAAGSFIIPMSSDPFTAILPWMLTNGATALNESWDQATFNTPASVESAEFARQVVAKGYSPEPGGAFAVNEQIVKGKLAGFPGGRWPILGMRDQGIVDKMKIVPMPKNTTHGSPIGWDAWAIFKDSEKKEAAWEFLKFMMSKDAGTYFAKEGGTIVPARISIANSDVFTNNAPEGTTELVEAVSYATPIASPAKGGQIQSKMINAWDKILAGNQDAAGALDQANKQIAGLL